MTEDTELTAIKAALNALQGLPDRRAWQRALDYITNRLSENERTMRLHTPLSALPEPLQYCRDGEINDLFLDATECALDAEWPLWSPIEVNGVAIVSQRFAVVTLIGDSDGNPDGEEVKWFSTRAEAEAYCAEGRTDG